MDKNAKITVVGSGYVGMSIAALLADKNKLTILDIDIDRVNKINSNQSTIEDALIDKLFLNNNLCIKATIDEENDIAFWLFLNLFDKIKRIPVKHKAIPTKWTLSNIFKK